MKLLADENFPGASVTFLRTAGYDVLYIAETHYSISDEAVLQLATKEYRLILTFDRDFGTLIFKCNEQPPAGVLYLRVHQFHPEEPGKWVQDLLTNKDLQFDQRLTVFDGERLRQRVY